MEVEQRTKEGMATYGAMKSIWKVKEVGMNAKKALYESIIVPTVLYGGETWGLREAETRCYGDEVSEKYVWSDVSR